MRARHWAVLFPISLMTAGCAGLVGAPGGESQSGETMDRPRPLTQVRVAIMDDPHVNVASAGAGVFYVTTGLLEKADDEEFRGVLAHEIAHTTSVTSLQRKPYSKEVMVHTLTWLIQTEGSSSGGFLAHPGTQERIDALAKP